MKIDTDDSHVLTVPSDGELPIQEDLSCWSCGNSLDPSEAIAVSIDMEGELLRVPMCRVCAPSEQTDAADKLAKLTNMEWEILALLAEGLTPCDIAEVLRRPLFNIKRQIMRLMATLDVGTMEEAAQVYVRFEATVAARGL